MDADWIKSPMARRVFVHWADSRPAWLWAEDGRTLLWRNQAARYFHGKLKKSGPRLLPQPVPIKGQVARLIRLGSTGRSSLSRMQLLAGDKPVSATCTVTPLDLPGEGKALLIVDVDPVDPDLLAMAEQPEPLAGRLFPPGADFLLIQHGTIVEGSTRARERFGPAVAAGDIPETGESETSSVEFAGEKVMVTRFRAGLGDTSLLLFQSASGEARIDEIRREEGLAALNEEAAEVTETTPAAPYEPLLPMGLPDADTAQPESAVEGDDHWAEPIEPPAVGAGRSLSSLFDRLADHDELYAPLADEEADREPAPDMIAKVIEFADDPEPPEEAPTESMQPDEAAEALDNEPEAETGTEGEPAVAAEGEASTGGVAYRVVGRRFTPLAVDAPPSEAEAAPAPPPADASTEEAAPDPEIVERVSRYNFDELSRILTDRVGNETSTPAEPEEAGASAEPVRRHVVRAADRALVNVAAETFILNRLPLGIMVFRDQQVLFANRALTELTGYESIDALRGAGLAAVFPSDGAAAAGPVTHLVDRSGTPLPVTARLQSITWQGRPALMLSASRAESRAGHEGVVKDFAEILADQAGEGFYATDKAGVITRISARGLSLLGAREGDVVGKPLRALIAAEESPAFNRFLEQPARFAETRRPSLSARGMFPGTTLLIFAEGQAGVLAGYFGLLRGAATAPARDKPEETDPAMLARVSRGIRRPLNTIVGFSDLIRSAAFGDIENQRYVEYARDIKTAGQEIAVLVDELDEFSRLREGRYAARPAELDLVALLETCVARVRGQSSSARVLVRSAISERLPRIRADQASMRQAVLNLLASAIEQTPAGGTVILSAQLEQDGSILVNVRDSGGRNADPAERFVIFRDGSGRGSEIQGAVRSSVGLALTRSLLAVNACSLSVDPSAGVGTMFSLVIPADVVAA